MEINYLKGDATNPIGEGNKIICHICNDIGAWGAGFVLALSKKWPEPEKQYREWHKKKFLSKSGKFELGNVQFVLVEEDVLVANMIAQRGIGWIDEIPPIRYGALEAALSKVGRMAYAMGASVHMPRIGCGLAGGEWSKVEKIVISELINRSVNVYVYDL